MKKLCLLLALLLIFTGCGKNNGNTPSNTEKLETIMVYLNIYAINDLHGKMADTDYQTGLDELSTYLKQPENGILLSTGDMWQGSSESNLTNGQIITEWMNAMNFTAMTMGGHEYDWGEEWIRKNQQLAQFPFLGINIYSRQTDRQVDYCQSSVVVEVDGAQIGIIGAIGNCYSSIAGENTKDVYFKTGEELTALVKAESEKLRSQGVDFVIYSIHDGYTQNTSDTVALAVDADGIESYYDISLSDGYVDLVFEADTHYRYVLQDDYGVYHLQSGGNNSGISHAFVEINKATGETSVLKAELLPDSTYCHLEDDPVVAELLEKYAAEIAPAAEILGINGKYRGSREICQLVANLYCTKGMERWSEEYDIVLGGGYISCRSPQYMPEGQVSYSQLQSLLPFDNRITLCSIQGRDLLEKFLNTSHSAYFIKTTPYGDHVRNSIDPDATYYVVTDRYSADYAYNRMTVIEEYDAEVFARDLVAEYIAAGGLE